ncbi:hypothetical protein VVD49_21455 [Uliginosibacterium sp. H3]|uniref:Uncharacterized protein n=1 Tax=Uliginosibacterium silvisoli TaxID=3114758 RepID=A0ABU6K8T6_9RHOO|nr:hypothetical protein [Uliginosibacterium sp. H3]
MSFGIDRNELERVLGSPERENKSRLWASELQYPAGVYRFNSDGKLKEVSADAAELEIEGERVSFESLRPFLEQRDKEWFERVGFLVSPKFGIAFDPNFPSWVTAFSQSELPLWRSIGDDT